MRIIGLDLALTSAHKVVVMEKTGRFLTPVLPVHTWPDELAALLARAREGEEANSPLVVVMEPTSLAWLPVAVYLLLHGVIVYLVNSQQVADLRRFYKKHAKSDRIDARVLAKLYLVAQEKLHALLLPDAAVYKLQRACKQVEWLVKQITRLENQIQALDRAAWLGGWEDLGFGELFSPTARWCRELYYNPYLVVAAGVEQIRQDWQSSGQAQVEEGESWIPALIQLAEKVIAIYGPMAAYVDFSALQAEVSLQQKWLGQFEQDRDHLRRQVVHPLYRQLHPSRNLETIYGVGEDGAPIYLSFIGEPLRFANSQRCRGWSGMAPASSQSSESEAKGLRISQAGPSLPKMFLFLGADIGRRFDPQLAKIYYDQMVHKGKHHTQAVCAVATHLLDRILVVLKEDRPCELKDVDGTPLSPQRAKEVIAEKYSVPDEVRQRNNRKARRQRREHQAERQEQRRKSLPELVRG